MRNLILIFLLGFSSILNGQDRLTRFEIQQQIDQIVNEQMNEQHIPGLALAILIKGKPFLLKGYGYTNVQSDERVSPSTLFGIGSCSKMITAFAVLLLIEDGKIHLSDSIRRYLPEAPLAWQPITIRELLSHTSGIPQHQGPHLPWSKIWCEMTRKRLQFQPDTQVKYSNFGFIILSHLIEIVSGQSYNAFVYERILKPLAMLNTSIPIEPFPPGLATGYKVRSDGWQNTRPLPWQQMWGSGGFVSNVIDLAKWDMALTAELLLKPETYRQMWTPVPLLNQESSGWSLGWHISHLQGKKIANKDGGIAGYRSFMTRDLNDQISIIILTNATPVKFEPLTKPIFNLLFELKNESLMN